MMLPLAHLGHWYVLLPFAAPVIALTGALLLLAWRERRRDREGTASPPLERESASPPAEPGTPRARR
jgi:hypothetical protein